MAPSLKFFYLANASLILLAACSQEAQSEPADTTTISYSVNLGNDGECLAEVNAAREAAKLSKLQQPDAGEAAKRLPSVDVVKPWEPLCKELIPARSMERNIAFDYRLRLSSRPESHSASRNIAEHCFPLRVSFRRLQSSRLKCVELLMSSLMHEHAFKPTVIAQAMTGQTLA
ncbi:SAG family member [Eimeria necatrix]|uniref:SAG family member n=1 Tax=Eimeria necatrix TaxID=51315 RepID=U6MX45_9EIME|nr:SAG family member [Eimeria necatrix]CDJ67049.1 SAG family member [Eimeria necatrix]